MTRLITDRVQDQGHWQYGNESVPYVLKRSRKRRTLGLTVTADVIRIHAPHSSARREIDAYVAAQRDWIARAWEKMRARAAVVPIAPTGSRYLGQPLAWVVREADRAAVRRVGRALHIDAPPGSDPAGLVRNWLQARAHKLLLWRLLRQARRAARTPAKIGLSDARSLWGSCTRSGTIRLNWRLAQAPLHLIDYVAAHELAHLVHLDHSPRFWAEVEKLCPDPRAHRAELRALGAELFRL